MSEIIKVPSGPLYCYKSEFTPDVYFIASMSDGKTFFEDDTPKFVRTWRRLTEYIKLYNATITKIRIQTPHKLIDFEGNEYKAFYSVCRIAKELTTGVVNNTKIYAVLRDVWDVYTIFDTDNWAHVGYHTAFVREQIPQEHTYEDTIKAISLNERGVVLNVCNK